MNHRSRLPARGLDPGRRSTTLLSLCVAGCCLGGCSVLYHRRLPNPIDGVSRVAVAPVFVSKSVDSFDAGGLGDIVASELVQFPDVDWVARPDDVVAALKKNQLTLESEGELRALARILRVQAILTVEITEFYRYYMPRIAVVGTLFLADSPLADNSGVIDLSRSARARSAAAFEPGDVIQVERIYDSTQRETHDDVWLYSLGLRNRNEALDGVDRVLNMPDLYFRFASDRLITALFEEYTRQLEEVRDKES